RRREDEERSHHGYERAQALSRGVPGALERQQAQGDGRALLRDQGARRRVRDRRAEIEGRGEGPRAAVHGAAPDPLAGVRGGLRGAPGGGHVKKGSTPGPVIVKKLTVRPVTPERW